MDADFSIELGREDPVLDFPWKDPSGNLAYADLKRHPELVESIEEARRFPALRELLCVLNSTRSTVQTAKCDAWATTELSPAEQAYEASHKFASYVDIVFSDIDVCRSFAEHERFVRRLVELLRQAPEMPSAAEVCVRRCYLVKTAGVREGFYVTLYVTGYGNDEAGARSNWEAGLKFMQEAIVTVRN
jgi:hypothetical protein